MSRGRQRAAAGRRPAPAAWQPALAALLMAGGAAGLGTRDALVAEQPGDRQPYEDLVLHQDRLPDEDLRPDEDEPGAEPSADRSRADQDRAGQDRAGQDQAESGGGHGPPIAQGTSVRWGAVQVRTASLQALRTAPQPPQPVRLIIPDVGIDMRVGPVGVGDDGQMAIPDDVDDVGWYRYGPAPGEPSGAAVLASHVDSWEGAGPFAHLRYDVTPGIRVHVESADGSVRSFQVVDNRMVPKPELPVDALFDRSGPARLVLVTCGGRFQRDVGRYTHNIVVTAVPVGG